jgi:hypothetical protein
MIGWRAMFLLFSPFVVLFLAFVAFLYWGA